MYGFCKHTKIKKKKHIKTYKSTYKLCSAVLGKTKKVFSAFQISSGVCFPSHLNASGQIFNLQTKVFVNIESYFEVNFVNQGKQTIPINSFLCKKLHHRSR